MYEWKDYQNVCSDLSRLRANTVGWDYEARVKLDLNKKVSFYSDS